MIIDTRMRLTYAMYVDLRRSVVRSERDSCIVVRQEEQNIAPPGGPTAPQAGTANPCIMQRAISTTVGGGNSTDGVSVAQRENARIDSLPA